MSKHVDAMTDQELSDEVTKVLAEEPNLESFDAAMRSLYHLRSVLREYADRHQKIKKIKHERELAFDRHE